MKEAMRPTEEIARLKDRCMDLERRVAELEPIVSVVQHFQESIEQLQAILECGGNPAPIFLRWRIAPDAQDSRVLWAWATYGKYRLEVVDGRSAVSWSIQQGERWIDGGCGMTHFDMGMDEAEAALRRIVQAAKKPPSPGEKE